MNRNMKKIRKFEKHVQYSLEQASKAIDMTGDYFSGAQMRVKWVADDTVATNTIAAIGSYFGVNINYYGIVGVNWVDPSSTINEAHTSTYTTPAKANGEIYDIELRVSEDRLSIEI